MSDALHWLTQGSNWRGPDGIEMRLLEHVWYSAVALAVASAIALPLGLLTGHTGRGGTLTAAVANAWRALPTLGLVLLVFRIAPLSVWPVLVALIAIAIPPVLLNADAGIRAVDPAVRDAARAMGMTGMYALLHIEVPLAVPLILTGLRSAAGQVIATATVAAIAGLGGLGRYIIDGYAARDVGKITAGAIVLCVLALAVDGVFAITQRALVSPRISTRFVATLRTGQLEKGHP